MFCLKVSQPCSALMSLVSVSHVLPWSQLAMFCLNVSQPCSALTSVSHVLPLSAILAAAIIFSVKAGTSLGLYHPLDGITNHMYMLFHFLTTKNNFCREEKALAFYWQRCCHLGLCLCLILFQWPDPLVWSIQLVFSAQLPCLHQLLLVLFCWHGFFWKLISMADRHWNNILYELRRLQGPYG